MGCLLIFSSIALIFSAIVGYGIHYILQPIPLVELNLQYWGPGKEKPDDKTIKPFKISFPESDLKYLKEKLDATRELTPPLENADFTSGINTDYFNTFVDFWKTKYNWTEREAFLNQYPQFKTQIGGLDIHFIHVKPDVTKVKGKQILPLLILHGWPGSVREFYSIIPMLTNPRNDTDFVFEIIAPSLPGYGFSQGASKQGLHQAHVGLIINELMTRLGHEKYYIHGGDWGSIIGHSITILRPERILGYHSNLCFPLTRKSILMMVLHYMFPKIFLEESMQESYVDQFSDLFFEVGYYNIQATKPETLGIALSDSPVGLAAYMIEKYATGTNRTWRSLPHGGIENQDKVELLDQVMIYWLTDSVTTSKRLYYETTNLNYYNLGINANPSTVPTACYLNKYEILLTTRRILEASFTNLVSYTYSPVGGHFAAMEQPELLSQDVWNFVKILRSKK